MVRNEGRPRLERRQYEIRFEGNLGSRGQEWFAGFSLRVENGDVTVLSGPMIDRPSSGSFLESGT